MFTKLKLAWQNTYHDLRQNLRQLTGEDAYERYLAHFYAHQLAHQNQQEEQNAEKIAVGIAALPLSRNAFFKEWQTSKWKGVKRCC